MLDALGKHHDEEWCENRRPFPVVLWVWPGLVVAVNKVEGGVDGHRNIDIVPLQAKVVGHKWLKRFDQDG